MRPLMNDALSLLLRGVTAILKRDPALVRFVGTPALAVTGCDAQPWASATFSGHRHRLQMVLRGSPQEVASARATIASSLPGAEFDLRGHMVADIALVGVETASEGDEMRCEMLFEALTIED